MLDSLNASLFVHDLPGAGKRGDFDPLADAFVEFGSDFRRPRNRRGLDFQPTMTFVMSLGADALVHVFVTVELSPIVEDGWSVRGTIPLEYGALFEAWSSTESASRLARCSPRLELSDRCSIVLAKV